uniref:Uncharacterized protein n=1 Tax=Cajanus cajan TaxID=3821 RepID=A0A151SX21_CAJCA|nr:hypothetical protein KK1_014769 [Cajanus cajan]
MGRRKKLHTIHKNESQVKKLPIDNSTGITMQYQEHNPSIPENNIQFGRGGKKTRGYTHMLDVWDMSDDEFIVVEVDALGNPMSSEGKTLLSAIGSLVRRHQCAPINYLSWKDMHESNITDMLELIQSKFQFVPELSEKTKRILKDNMSNKWRQFKHDLKSKAYDASKTEEEMAANIPNKRVDPSQYHDLVHH